ncbi:hypothetical protein NCCP133_02640 [Cytobacillus sp. NCCP-133]|nr:hypothetical protein NCCP133_02640 [Cytobacillus sp. NCCP-133]
MHFSYDIKDFAYKMPVDFHREKRAALCLPHVKSLQNQSYFMIKWVYKKRFFDKN